MFVLFLFPLWKFTVNTFLRGIWYFLVFNILQTNQQSVSYTLLKMMIKRHDENVELSTHRQLIW